jgi:hypothetical protein
VTNFSAVFIKETEFWNNATHIHLSAIVVIYHDGNSGCDSSLSRAFSVGIPSWMGFLVTTYCCLRPFWWESLRVWDFRPQLIVVSGLFGGNPFVDGILGHNLLLSRTFFTTSSPFYDGILAIKKPFSQTFLFHDGILAIRKPFSQTFSFFTMEL